MKEEVFVLFKDLCCQEEYERWIYPEGFSVRFFFVCLSYEGMSPVYEKAEIKLWKTTALLHFITENLYFSTLFLL